MKTIQTDTRYSMVDRLEITEPTPGVLSLTARWDGDRNIVRRTEHLDGPSDITRTVNRPRPDRSTTGVLSGLAVVLTPMQALELASALTTFATATLSAPDTFETAARRYLTDPDYRADTDAEDDPEPWLGH